MMRVRVMAMAHHCCCQEGEGEGELLSGREQGRVHVVIFTVSSARGQGQQ